MPHPALQSITRLDSTGVADSAGRPLPRTSVGIISHAAVPLSRPVLMVIGGGPMTRPARSPRPAAVMLPFYRDSQGVLRLILVERAPRGRHAGHIALPGGNQEPYDCGPRTAAMREATEELGVTPNDLEILDELSPLHTKTTGYQVWPFVARFNGTPGEWHPQRSEITSIIDVDVAELANPSTAAQEQMMFASWDAPRTVPVRRIAGRVVWGFTLRLLEPVLPRVLNGEWDL